MDPNPRAIELRIFRASFVTIPLALVAFAFSFAMLLWFATSKPAAWLATRQPLALAIVGTIWCLCLSPRAIGVGLLVAALPLAFAAAVVSRAPFSSSRIAASAAFTTSPRRACGILSAAAKNACARILVPRGARLAVGVLAIGLSFPV